MVSYLTKNVIAIKVKKDAFDSRETFALKSKGISSIRWFYSCIDVLTNRDDLGSDP